MRRLLVFALSAFAAPGLLAHTVTPPQGGSMTITYLGQPGRITVLPAMGEQCVVTAEAVEVFITTPLLTIQSTDKQPALSLFFSVSPSRHPVNRSETTTARVSWRATGFREDGSADSDCNGSGEVSFNVTVVEPAAPTSSGNNPNQGTAAEPVSTFTGEYYTMLPADLTLAGPLPIHFSRYYGSRLVQEGITGTMGKNWRHNYEMRLTRNGSNATVVTNNGATIAFQKDGAAWSLSGSRAIRYQLGESASGYTLAVPDSQFVYRFDSTGRLVAVSDGRGNNQTLTYTDGRLTEVTDGLGARLALAYDGAGKVTSVSDGSRTVAYAYAGDLLSTVTDPRGGMTRYSYNPSGLLAGITRPDGNVPLTQVFDSEGRVTSQTDAFGNATRLSYNTATRTTTVTDPAQSVHTHVHSATGELLSHNDSHGNVALNYNASGQRTGVVDRTGTQTRYTFDPLSGKVNSITNPDGGVTAFQFRPRVNEGVTVYDLAGVTYPNGATTTLEYDARGNPTRVVDSRGGEWRTSYNDRSQPRTMTNPLGGVTTNTYTSSGLLESSTDPAGNRTSFEYDVAGRLTKVTFADGSTRTFVHDPAGNPTQTTDERGGATSFTYDANDNVVSITNALGETLRLTYDAMDRVTAVTDAKGNVTSRTYDSLGRLATDRDRNGTVRAYEYDSRGRLIQITDASGRAWTATRDSEGALTSLGNPKRQARRFESDSMGRLVRALSPRGNASVIRYDRMGRVAESEDALGRVTRVTRSPAGDLSSVRMGDPSVAVQLERNAMGAVTSATDANGKPWQRAYDTQGRLTTTTDPLGNQVRFSYDKRNRISRVTFPLGSAEMTYDPFGNVTRRRFSDGLELNYSYDALNRLTSANGLALTADHRGQIVGSNGITMVRDSGGRLTEVTLAAGKTIRYQHDPRNLTTSVTDWLGGVTRFTYDESGLLTTIERPNGIRTTYVYDADDAVASITDGSIASISITRDAVGQITNAVRNVPEPPPLPAGAIELSYDAASEVATNQYDTLGRLLSDGRRQYRWDLASRLTGYSEAGSEVSLSYDAVGHRIGRASGAFARSYVWNYGLLQPAVQIERQGQTDRRYYVTTPVGALLYMIDAETGARFFYHFDEMGNTTFLTDDAGRIVARYAYEPYGQLRGVSGSVENPYTWQGQYGVATEGSSGLYLMHFRYYDSEAARFLSRDPVRSVDPRSLNPYQYAWRNPLGYHDPLGLQPQEACPAPTVEANRDSVKSNSPGQQGANKPSTSGTHKKQVLILLDPDPTMTGQFSLQATSIETQLMQHGYEPHVYNAHRVGDAAAQHGDLGIPKDVLKNTVGIVTVGHASTNDVAGIPVGGLTYLLSKTGPIDFLAFRGCTSARFFKDNQSEFWPYLSPDARILGFQTWGVSVKFHGFDNAWNPFESDPFEDLLSGKQEPGTVVSIIDSTGFIFGDVLSEQVLPALDSAASKAWSGLKGGLEWVSSQF